MKRPTLCRCGHSPGTLSPEDQAAVDQFRAMLTAVRNPQPWEPGSAQDVAVRVGPFVERAHVRPGDDRGPEVIAVALVHPDTPHAVAYLHGRQLGYIGRGWLRCETAAILGVWQPGHSILTHAAANLSLPDDLGMDPAHYAVTVEACKEDGNGHTLLRLGPYVQTGHASHDVARITTALAGRETALVPGAWISAWTTAFDASDHEGYVDPYTAEVADVAALLDDAIAGTST
ncbi:hypothetical protein ACIO3O_40125 [Streptomyces sp. NPDC087440]|uniref:hypothetical protein n=1 Tax=Streptomyces sp. NPDC087440 TaxID=3365790 RepID=UPI003808DCCD